MDFSTERASVQMAESVRNTVTIQAQSKCHGLQINFWIFASVLNANLSMKKICEKKMKNQSKLLSYNLIHFVTTDMLVAIVPIGGKEIIAKKG